jgi:RNA polymerase sigma-70 factor (ECF subfamily)
MERWERGGVPGTAAAVAADEVDEAVLLARARADRRAFEPLYRRHLGAVYGYCYRRLGDAAAAEDATQQVFAQALAKLDGFRGEVAFQGWLFAIARNVTANLCRDRRPHRSLDGIEEPVDGGLSPEELAIRAEEVARVRVLLGRLTDGQREVVELRFSGVSVRDTARIVGCGEGAVKQLQHRAVVRLREWMGAAAPGGGGDGA